MDDMHEIESNSTGILVILGFAFYGVQSLLGDIWGVFKVVVLGI